MAETQAEALALHGKIVNSSHFIGITVQLMIPQSRRQCPVCKDFGRKRTMRLFEEPNHTDGGTAKKQWWICQRESHDDHESFVYPGEYGPRRAYVKTLARERIAYLRAGQT